ncbi:MAG: hypothetical protein ACYTFD_17525 [Planctomycetota bacterium]
MAYPEASPSMRLSLAAELIRDRRPSRALEHLAALGEAPLPPEQRTRRAQLEAEARAARDRGGLELE